MQKLTTAVMGLVVFAGMAGVSRADVEGQAFQISVSSTVSGQFDGIVVFETTTFSFFPESGNDGDGTYTESGGAFTIITGQGNDGEDYMGSFIGWSYDPKQLPGLLGAIARRQGTPATISGRGAGNAGDRFTFEGEEIQVTAQN